MRPRVQALDVLTRPPHGPNKVFNHVVALRPIAKRFVFDAEGSAYLGAFIRDGGDLLIANRQFAIPPFETTYIQIDLPAMHAALGRATSDSLPEFKRGAADSQVGYLLHKREVHPMALTDGSAMLTTFQYETDTPSGPGPIFEEPVQLFDDNDEWARAALLLGSTIQELPDEATRLAIIQSVRVRLIDDRFLSVSRMQRRTQITGSAGDIRTVWAALLLINAKHGGVSFQDVPWQASLYKGKRKVFGSHSVVRIHLAPKQSIRALMRPGLHTPKAAHDVKGHFAHFHLRDGCAHVWPALPELNEDGIPRWHCSACGGRRTWKKAYTTGDAGRGFTTTEYAVQK